MHTKFWSEILKGRDHSEDLGVDGRIISESIFGDTGWNHPTQDRDQWRALVNTVINLRVP